MNASRRCTPIALFLCPLLLLNAGCETAMKNKEALMGGAIGSALGAGIGKAVGGDTGMAVGIGVGLVAGALVGQYVATQERTRTQTTASVGYRPEQGNLLAISEATAAPTTAQKGDRVKVSFKYTILRPDEEQAQVKETHEIRHNGVPVETLPNSYSLAQGEQRITWEYPVKRNAEAGTYQILTTAQVDEKQTASIVSFTVK